MGVRREGISGNETRARWLNRVSLALLVNAPQSEEQPDLFSPLAFNTCHIHASHMRRVGYKTCLCLTLLWTHVFTQGCLHFACGSQPVFHAAVVLLKIFNRYSSHFLCVAF